MTWLVSVSAETSSAMGSASPLLLAMLGIFFVLVVLTGTRLMGSRWEGSAVGMALVAVAWTGDSESTDAFWIATIFATVVALVAFIRLRIRDQPGRHRREPKAK